MQFGIPLNIADLTLAFQQHDCDQDGQVNDSEANLILKQIGYQNIYIGAVRKIIKLFNLDQPSQKTISLLQLQQFLTAMQTEAKFKLWKSKYKLLENIKSTHSELYGDHQTPASPSSQAGPGPAPSPVDQPKVSGDHSASISLKAGNSLTYNQQISLKIQKQKGPQTKPFIKISIEKKTHQEAKLIESLFKQIYDTLIEIIKAEEDWISSEFSSVSFITNVEANLVTLYVTTDNQALNELLVLSAEYFDLLFKEPVNGKIESSFQFNFDFERFLTEPSYNLHDIVVKDSKLELEWTLWQLFRNFREIGLKSTLLKELAWNDTDYFSLFMIFLLHTEKFTGKVEFENTSTENQETKSKEILAKILANYRKDLQDVQNEFGMNIVELVEQIDGKIKIEAALRDWKIDFQANLQNFSKLFTQTVVGFN